MYLFNTLTKEKEEFIPIYQQNAKIYSCGPTVYNRATIGNLRPYIFSDILRRTLQYNDYKVKQVINITDFGHLTSDADVGEDKMLLGLKREKLPLTLSGMKTLADKSTEAFKEDLQR
ncbi:MAG: cysteine--tRNA ligase, partial [Parcubacteria group bacterium]|nr:cysteine--tRNA ligase [Parcubacteria group bacterium]